MEDYAAFIATKGSVGYDLQSAEDTIITGGKTQVIETVMVGPLTEDQSAFGLVCSRSGLAANNSIFVLNAPGVIDLDYTGTIKVILHNASTEPFEINKGSRIAQILVFKKDVLVLPENVDAPERNDGGLGSTGK